MKLFACLFLAHLFTVCSFSQIQKRKAYFRSIVPVLCGESFWFHDTLGFFYSGCEANDADMGAFFYEENHDSLRLKPISLAYYPIIRKTIKQCRSKQPGIQVEVYDIENKPFTSVTLLLFERRKRKHDSLLGRFSSFTSEQIKKYRNPQKYYWTVGSVYPFFANELTLSFSFKDPFNFYRFYFNLPSMCLFYTEIKKWVSIGGLLRSHGENMISAWNEESIWLYKINGD